MSNKINITFMQLLVLGPGCARCKTLAQLTEQAVKELGITAERVRQLQNAAIGRIKRPAKLRQLQAYVE